jgi:hypothetical protein
MIDDTTFVLAAVGGPDEVVAISGHSRPSGPTMTVPSDTSIDAARAQLELLREKSPGERAALVVRLSSDVVQASKRAIARAHPELTARQVGYLFVELHYGRALAEAVRQCDRTRDDGRQQ